MIPFGFKAQFLETPAAFLPYSVNQQFPNWRRSVEKDKLGYTPLTSRLKDLKRQNLHS